MPSSRTAVDTPDMTRVEEIKPTALRRLIAQRMNEAKRNIPHFSYIEEMDVTQLEILRETLNSGVDGGDKLTYLPFIVTALTHVLPDCPQCNAHYVSERGVLLRHRAVHVGIATQAQAGLLVPVLRHAERRSLRELTAEIRHLSEAARTRKVTHQALSGSTITVTRLGRLGGIGTTPIINAPEVTVIGVNRVVERPVVKAGAIVIRRMMNVSASFVHRFIDGYDGAAMIQALKFRLENPDESSAYD